MQNSRQTILIAEDDRFSRNILTQIIKKEGYQVVGVANGEECIEAYLTHQPDLVLLDVMMPIMDGFTCCQKLQELTADDPATVMMITGLEDSESIKKALEVGALDYVTKPIQPFVLTFRLRRLLDSVETQKALHKYQKTIEEQNHSFQSELDEAAEYIRSLLPASKDKQLSIEQHFVPSLQLGGDFFDYFWISNEHLVIYLLDVSGHGTKSALLSVSMMNLLRNKSVENPNFYSPTAVLKELNRVICQQEYESNYLTIWYGVFNNTTKELTYCCAGHPPALLFFRDNSAEILSLRKLEIGGLAAGLFYDVDYEQESLTVPSESSLYLYSDASYEVYSEPGKILGLDGFIQLLTNYHQNQVGDIESIYQKILKISNNVHLDDDFSILKIDLT